MDTETKNSRLGIASKMTAADSLSAGRLDSVDLLRRSLGSIAVFEADVIYLVDYKKREMSFLKNRYGKMCCIEFDSFRDLLKEEFELQEEWQFKGSRVIKVVKW